jgi:hypothetical protein
VNDLLASTTKIGNFLNIEWDELQVIYGQREVDCIDFEVENTHSYISNNLISHNSTTLANSMIAECIGIPYFKSFFISPVEEQTRRFSHTRIGKTLTGSPEVRKAFLSDTIDSVYMRIFKNGSEMLFSYAQDNADRCRGVSADLLCVDEIQDIVTEVVLPVVEESMANSSYAKSIYSGTPKTTGNGIQSLHDISSKTEWVMKCDACNKFTFITTAKCVGLTGPECLNCRKPLNVRNGQWVDMQASKPIKGFHISQLILPLNCPAAWTSQADKDKAQERWNRIMYKHNHYGESQFENEVLAVSSGVGTQFLAKDELDSFCNENLHLFRLPNKEMMKDVVNTYAGVDFGGSESADEEGFVKSRTVLTILGKTVSNKLKVLYYRIYPVGHSTTFLDDMAEVCRAYNAQLVMCDQGGGGLSISILKEKIGEHKVHGVRYGQAAVPLKWNNESRNYMSDKTVLIDSFALFMKQKKMIFASQKEMEPAINDILNEFEELTASGRRIWRCSPAKCDDFLHSSLYAWVAYKLVNQDMVFAK